MIEENHLKEILRSQYLASLQMLKKAIDSCSEELWLSDKYANRTWQLVYHTLFFTDLYLYPHLDQRQHYPAHRKNYQNLGDHDGKEPYTRDQVIFFVDYIIGRLDSALEMMDLQQSDSGFYWYSIGKLEHQLVNLKHLQHHLGQLMDRLRQDQQIGISWINDGHSHKI